MDRAEYYIRYNFTKWMQFTDMQLSSKLILLYFNKSHMVNYIVHEVK